MPTTESPEALPTTQLVHRHLGDHQSILADLPRGKGRARLDALIVPTNRSPEHLVFAARLAARLRVPLIVITTRRWSHEQSRDCLGDRRGAVVKLRRSRRRGFFGLSVAGLVGREGRRYADTAAKRNLGLMLAVAMGWETVLFLDDDTRRLKSSRVVSAVHALRASDQLNVVGFRSTHFPDNSVVCHLRRAVGLLQTQFIGSGALLVSVDRDVPFFPPVYNEDWLFLHDWVTTGRVASGGTVGQLAFDPFDPQRARREEFGDVLAEGLFELGHLAVSLEERVAQAGQREFWRGFIEARRQVHRDVGAGLDRVQAEGTVGERANVDTYRLVLAAAVERLAQVTPEQLVRFVTAWRSDLVSWREQLAVVKPAVDLEIALRRLGFRRGHINS